MATCEGTQSGNVSSRNRNFSEAEDLLICSAWSNATTDATIANYQNASTFWKRAHAYWLKYKEEDYPNRNPDALMQRFSRIKTSVSKFCGYLSKVQSLSGQTEMDKVEKAKRMYSELESKGGMRKNGGPKREEFKFEHCWNVLRYDKKWLEITNETPKGSEVPHSNDKPEESEVPHNGNVNDSPSPIDVDGMLIRKKLVKERQKKRKRKFVCDNSPLLERIDRSRETNEKIFSEVKVMFIELDKKLDKLLEVKKEKLELEKKKLEMDEKRADTNLMMLDVSSFTDPVQIQFFEIVRKDIMEKYLRSK